MEIETIKSFVTLAECLNFTKAAEQEHVTQTAMSRKIGKLEDELGVTLFFRDNRQVELTPAGKEFYVQSQRILALVTQAVETVQNIQDGFSKELKIGVGLYEEALISNFLGDYLKKNPTLRISCSQYPYHQLLKLFEQNLIDVMVSSDQFLQHADTSSYYVRLISDQDWLLGVSRDNPLAELDAIPLTAFTKQVLITMYEGSASQVLDYYRSHKIPLKNFMSVNSFQTKAVLINANMGVGFLPHYVSVCNHPNIVLKRLDFPYRPRRFYIVCKKDTPSFYARDFTEKYAQTREKLLKND